MWFVKGRRFPASIRGGGSGGERSLRHRRSGRGRGAVPCSAVWTVVLAALAFCSGCKRPSDRVSNDREGTEIPPLRARNVPSPPSTVVVAAEGATSALPVVALLSEREGDCERLGRAYEQRAHLLCSRVGRIPESALGEGKGSAGPTAVEEAMHAGLSFLKSNYPRHVAPSPVHLFVAPPYAEVGLRMMLREPSVFAYTFIEGLRTDALRAPTMLGLQEGGARILLLDSKIPLRTQALAQAAQRRGFWIAAVGEAELGWTRATRTFQKADPRLR